MRKADLGQLSNWALTPRQWFAMPRNLIFLGLHLIIGKRKGTNRRLPLNDSHLLTNAYRIVYANSLLASLNVRQELRQIHIGIGSRSQHPWSLSPRAPGYMGHQPGPLYTIKVCTSSTGDFHIWRTPLGGYDGRIRRRPYRLRWSWFWQCCDKRIVLSPCHIFQPETRSF